MIQDRAQHHWGTALPPGRYHRVVSRNAWQTCFLVPADTDQPIAVLNQDAGGSVISPH